MIIKEIEKSQAHITAEIIGYKVNSVLIKPIVKKTYCDISVMSFDSGAEQKERNNLFDSFVQIIEGHAVFVIDGISHIVETGQCLMIPSKSPSAIKANGRFKMVLTVLKENE